MELIASIVNFPYLLFGTCQIHITGRQFRKERERETVILPPETRSEDAEGWQAKRLEKFVLSLLWVVT
jgi:hypothetical protein